MKSKLNIKENVTENQIAWHRLLLALDVNSTKKLVLLCNPTL